MSSVIWKYEIGIGDGIQIVDMPFGARVMTAQMQVSTLCLWAMVEPSERLTRRTFIVYGTGHRIGDDDALTYVGTVQVHGGALVFHVFEVTS